MADACKFTCLDTKQAQAVELQLLCEILQGGGTGTTCLLDGIGPPVVAGPCPFSLYREGPGPNFGLWIWDGVSAWSNAIAQGP